MSYRSSAIPSEPPGFPERVIIVDRNNRSLGVVSRPLMRSQGLIHRASYVLVRNRRGELFIQKRSMGKDVFPGYWDIAAGGVVQERESYEDSARRELLEELGVEVKVMHHLFDHFHDGEATRVWGRVFTCTHEGPFTLQREEIDHGRFLAPEALFELHGREPITPDGMEILRRLQEEAPVAWLRAPL